jgi:3-hydroxyisobutyrate dehydrogenase
MAGGADADLDAAEPMLRAMGTSIHRCGPVGAGQAMKALNNLVSAGGFLIGIEALLIGQKFGLEPGQDGGRAERVHRHEQLHPEEIPAVRAFAPLRQRLRAGADGEGPVHRAGVGKEAGVPAPLAALVRELSAAALAHLGPGQDHTALAKLSEALAGQVLAGGNG